MALSTSLFFFFNAPAPTEIYTLSLHDALPIYAGRHSDCRPRNPLLPGQFLGSLWQSAADRKSTRLNSSHTVISYAVFCLKKKNELQMGKDPPPAHFRNPDT